MSTKLATGALTHAIHKGRRHDDPLFYCECGEECESRQAALEHIEGLFERAWERVAGVER